MNITKDMESVAFFGSQIRGDFDQFSDQDILVATDANSSEIEFNLKKAGFSPSIYTWIQLDRLSNEGALFLQHLKQESKILVDKENKLQTLLTNYIPKNDYSKQIHENLALIELTSGVPDVPGAVNWAFDVLAVALRNHAILTLAQDRCYQFSYPKLVSEISDIYRLNANETSLLLALRFHKRAYRIHPLNVNTTLNELQQTQAVVEKITGVTCLSKESSISNFIAKILTLENKPVTWYCQLRGYEGIFRSLGYVPKNDSQLIWREIENVFSSASRYCADGLSSNSWLKPKIYWCINSISHKNL